MRGALLALGLATACATSPPTTGDVQRYDVVVYGGTSAGVVAAVQATRMGQRVALVVPSGRLGGLTASGLGQTDSGNTEAIGGLAREFYREVHGHYADESAWTREERDAYRWFEPGGDAMWRFEPHVAEAIFESWVVEAGPTVFLGRRLARPNGTWQTDRRLDGIELDDGTWLLGRAFIDATYEGDLMADAGVPYVVGRESNEEFDETLNGVQVGRAVHHQFTHAVDPFAELGDPASRLLPSVWWEWPTPDGGGDDAVQAYCYRLCLTDDPDNQLRFERPEDYDERDYELLLRHFEAGSTKVPWYHGAMPNRKTDTNNNGAVSMDFIGESWDWPEASDERRVEIAAEHERWQRGLLWTLANHPRVPESVRAEVSRWGLAADEFVATGGWPHALYVREGRRMRGRYVVTENDCLHRRVTERPVGLGAYTMDSHHVRRYVDADGHVRNEGDVQVRPVGPYPIAYGAMLPPEGAVENLLVPVALSATHIAFGSLRMEPVFMILGQSAATAACLSLEHGTTPAELPYSVLRERLLADGQLLAFEPEPPPGIEPSSLDGIVVDDADATGEGAWFDSTSVQPFVGVGYRHDNADRSVRKQLRFALPIEAPGRYALELADVPHANRSSRTRVWVAASDGLHDVFVDQRTPAVAGSLWRPLGEFDLAPGAEVGIDTAGADGYVTVDAVRASEVSAP